MINFNQKCLQILLGYNAISVYVNFVNVIHQTTFEIVFKQSGLKVAD